MSWPISRRPYRCALYTGAIAITLLALGGCRFFADQPEIYWNNYDAEQGLGVVTELPSGSYATRALSPVGIPGGIVCNDLLVLESGENETLWAATLGPLLYSNDEAQSWTAEDGNADEDMHANDAIFPHMIQYPRQLIETPDGSLIVMTPYTVMRSTDGGMNWTRIHEGHVDVFGSPEHRKMALVGDQLYLYASTIGEVSRISLVTGESQQRGFRWTPGADVRTFAVHSDGRVFYGSGSGIYVTDEFSSPLAPVTNFASPQTGWYPMELLNDSLWLPLDGVLTQMSPDTGEVLWPVEPPELVGVVDMEINGTEILVVGADGPDIYVAGVATDSGNSVTDYGSFTADAPGSVTRESDGTIWVSYSGAVARRSPTGDWFHHVVTVSTVSRIEVRDGEVWAGLFGGGVARYDPVGDEFHTVVPGLTVYDLAIRANGDVIVAGEDFVLDITNYGSMVGEPVQIDPGMDLTTGGLALAGSGDLFIVARTTDASGSERRYETVVYRREATTTEWVQDRVLVDSTQSYSNVARPCLVVDEDRGLLWVTTMEGLWKRSLTDGNWTQDPEFASVTLACMSPTGNLYVQGDTPAYAFQDIYRLQAGASQWGHLPESGWSDPGFSEMYFDANDAHWLASQRGLRFNNDPGFNPHIWLTTADGLASNYCYSVVVTGKDNDREIWVGTNAGASRGTFLDVPPQQGP